MLLEKLKQKIFTKSQTKGKIPTPHMENSNFFTSTSSSDGEDRFWGSTSSIDNKALTKLALATIYPNGEPVGVSARVVNKLRGGYNNVYVVRFTTGLQIVVKVPAMGQEGRWREEDEHNLRSEALTMRYIKKHTKVPIPEVYHFSATLSNEIDAPFIMMEFIEGVPAKTIWGESDSTGRTARGLEKFEQRRQTLLKSLAESMAELRHLEFGMAGRLEFDDDADTPKIGPVFLFDGKIDETSGKFVREIVTITPSHSTFENLDKGFDERFKRWKADETIVQGVSRIIQTALDCKPFTEDQEKPFVLHHPDLHRLNILCDPETCKVKAIIDWDWVQTTPRCVGYASLPKWLQQDWRADESEFSPAVLEAYRKDYTKYMTKAMGGQGDCIYTAKNAIYAALDAGTFGKDGHPAHWVIKALPMLLAPMSTDEAIELLEEGDWRDHSEYIVYRLEILLDPSSPPLDIF
ncbi:hypothetical protein BU16DRAFT_591315 [Lophium mytilinum]|uniref:Aminoglycoside phosphotransferase domain-containing protein n=1 Tax=Lophium mytilinum TaxID=390894 RepID=A0A6A6QQ82_9PEZI|nr:hypothetical protein BU16DRAFT_591315 [Lophium mytilinum]